MNILLTGGAGYIGSHAVRRLLAEGHRLVVVDDFRHGHPELLDAACAAAPERMQHLAVDVADGEAIHAAMLQFEIEAVMHFAAYIEVGESVREPLKYYRNNFVGSLALLDAVVRAGIRKFIFSSTAAVYGEGDDAPMLETQPRAPINPYGRSKMMVEMALEDACAAHGVGYAILRYFNVAGASADGRLGEWHEPETHLIPRVLAAALTGAPVSLFGTDYPTRDGTCLRDYVHVEDLVSAHVLALYAIVPGCGEVYNVGSESGCTVREVISACEAVTGRSIQVSLAPRRAGDPAVLVASSLLIRRKLGWVREFGDMPTIVAHAWAWHRKGHAFSDAAYCGHAMHSGDAPVGRLFAN